MPTKLAEAPTLDFLNLLVISPARTGKTHLLGTAPRPIYVIASDPINKLDSAGQADKKRGMADIVYDPCNASEGKRLYQQFENCLAEAARGAKAGEYKTVAWDTITSFGALALYAELEATNTGNGPDGRRAYGAFGNAMMGAVWRLSKIPCHLLILAHDYPSSGKIEGQLDKRGPGILPNIGGSVRAQIPGQYRDVAYLQKKKESEERELVTSMAGVWGIGCNSKPGVSVLPADITAFINWKSDKPAAPVKVVSPSGKVTVKSK